MVAIVNFVFFILDNLLWLLWLAVIISAVMSWLFAFEVINSRNQVVNQISYVLDRITDPLLRPFRRVIPPLGGIDISPIVALLVLLGVKNILLPALHNALLGVVA